MRLSSALRETVLQRATVVAAHDSLDREISWVHIVDHPDVATWLRTGHLLLSSGYQWPRDDAGLAGLVDELAMAGVAAVVLAVPRYLEHVPEAMVRAASKRRLPLLEIPWEVPFSQITEEVLAHIIGHQSQVIAQAERIHREMMSAALTASSLKDIAGALQRLLSQAVFFTDPDGTLIGAPGEVAGHMLTAVSEVLRHRRMSLSQVSDGQAPIPLCASKTEEPYLGWPVKIGEEVAALLWVQGREGVGLAARAAEHAAVIAALHLAHQREFAAQETRLGQALVSSLLDGQFTASQSSMERARLSGWEAQSDYRVCLVLMNEPTPLTSSGLRRRDEWSARITAFLRTERLAPLVSAAFNYVRFLLPAACDPQHAWRAIGDGKCAMAVSRMNQGVEGMAMAAQDVAALIPLLRPGHLHDFVEAAIPRALMGDSGARQMVLQRFIRPLLDTRGGEALFETLAALCDEGFQLANTAKALDIHISTLRYRIERIEMHLDTALDRPAARFEVQVALAMHRLQNQ